MRRKPKKNSNSDAIAVVAIITIISIIVVASNNSEKNITEDITVIPETNKEMPPILGEEEVSADILHSISIEAFNSVNYISGAAVTGNNSNGTNPSLASCYETDNGPNTFVKGTSSGQNDIGEPSVYVDKCASANSLLEYYCQGTKIMKWQTTCTYGCSDGACVNLASCSDSDGGKSPDLRGDVLGTNFKGVKTSATDKCVSTNRLLEYYCISATQSPVGYYIACPNGCSNGACKTAAAISCTDTDGGKNYNKLGTLTAIDNVGISYTKTDYCASENAVSEYYCVDASHGKVDYNIYCKYGCKNGACNPAPPEQAAMCKDSEGKYGSYASNVYTPGEVLCGLEVHRDRCFISEKEIEEFSLDSAGKLKSEKRTCLTSCAKLPTLHGYCLQIPPPPAPMTVFKVKEGKTAACADSDNGLDLYSKGTLAHTYEYSDTSYATAYRDLVVTGPTDKCKDSKTLIEFYCGSKGPDVLTFSCDGYCENGMCKLAGLNG